MSAQKHYSGRFTSSSLTHHLTASSMSTRKKPAPLGVDSIRLVPPPKRPCPLVDDSWASLRVATQSRVDGFGKRCHGR